MRSSIALASALSLLTACGQQPATQPSPATSQEAATSKGPADACASNAAVAVDFVNLYVKHLESNGTADKPVDTYEWLKASTLVDRSLASAYAAADTTESDPILDAQDFPDAFAFASCPGPAGLVEVKAIGEPAMTVRVLVAGTGDDAKVTGVGALNMADASPAPSPTDSASAITALEDASDLGATVECIENKDQAPAFGSSHDGKFYLCRETIEMYWNDWYGARKPGSKDVLLISGEGKTAMFEGELAVDCKTRTARWLNATRTVDEPITQAEIREIVPAKAVANARRYICG